MSYEIMKELVEKFSCQLIQANIEESKSLLVLLPTLKNLHSQCLKLSLSSQAKKIRTSRNLINNAIKNNFKNISEQITALNVMLSEFSKSFQNSDQEGQNLPLTSR